MTKQHKRHFFRHLVCAILSVLLTASLVITGLVGVLSFVLFDRGMHEDVALDPQVTDAQMERINRELAEVCKEYPVSIDTLTALITHDSIVQYNRDIISWWMDMLQNGVVTTAPVWNGGDLISAIRADEVFLASVPAPLQKATARDQVAVAVQDVVTDAVLPIRGILITFGMAQLLERIDLASYTALVRITPLVTLGVSALLTAAIALIFRGRPRRRALWGSSPFMAVGFIILFALVLLSLLNMPAQVAAMNEIFALQVSTLLEILSIRMALMSVTCLLGGAAWMHLAYRSSRLKAAKRRRQEV